MSTPSLSIYSVGQLRHFVATLASLSRDTMGWRLWYVNSLFPCLFRRTSKEFRSNSSFPQQGHNYGMSTPCFPVYSAGQVRNFVGTLASLSRDTMGWRLWYVNSLPPHLFQRTITPLFSQWITLCTSGGETMDSIRII
jgi:Flp pilus assembly protein CpaB